MYIDGHIVSKSSLCFITNLLTATAASRIEQSDDSSEDSAVEAWQNLDLQVGNLDLVHQTLPGIAARSSDEGQKALGRHARTIRLGRSLWQSDPLSSEIVTSMQERMFDDGCFPPLAEMRSIVAKAKKTRRAAASTLCQQDTTIRCSLGGELRHASPFMDGRNYAGS
jgi:hypothetical protein